jgi:hypothetical protein
MNKLFVGFSKSVEPPKGGYLLITDEVPDIPRSRVFDPMKHSFNPLKDIDYKRARELSRTFLYDLPPRGQYAHREEWETRAPEGPDECRPARSRDGSERRRGGEGVD